jgi:hypothetical protein
MPSQKDRIAAYVSSAIFSEFKRFKSERSLKSDSEALTVILSEFLGVGREVSYEMNQAFLQHLKPLQDRIEKLETLFGGIDQMKPSARGELDSESPDQGTGLLLVTPANQCSTEKVPDLTTGESISELLIDPLNEGKLDSMSLPEIGLLGNKLAKRLGVGQSTLSARKKDSPDKFAKWSSEKDPSGVAWESHSSGVFQPIGGISDELKSELFGEQPRGITTGELAKRIGVDSSTLSHWKSSGKKGKSPEDMLKIIREKDPDGIGWVFDAEIGRFVPETEFQNLQGSTVQGELLSELKSELPEIKQL